MPPSKGNTRTLVGARSVSTQRQHSRLQHVSYLTRVSVRMYDDTTRPARAMVAAARVGGGAERHRHVAAVHKAGVVPGAAELTAGLAKRAGSRGEAGSGEDAGGPSRMPVVWRKA